MMILNKIFHGGTNALLTLLLLLLSTLTIVESSKQNHPSPNCPLKIPSHINRRPVVLGHNGAAFNLPENTLESMRLALELGADAIDVILVPTKDNNLIANFDSDLNHTTNVMQIFPEKGRWSRHFKSASKWGRRAFYTHDFTLDEIKQLRVKQHLDDGTSRSDDYDYLFQVPTFEDIVDMMYEWNINVRNAIGADTFSTVVRPSLHIQTWGEVGILDDANINVADLIMEKLRTNEKARKLFFDSAECDALDPQTQYLYPPLVFASRHRETLTYLRSMIWEDPWHAFHKFVPPIEYVVTHDTCTSPDFWTVIDELDPDGIAPEKGCLDGLDTNEEKAREFMIQAHEHNVAIHPWTQRLELRFINRNFKSSEDELQFLYCNVGVDGIYAENVDLAVRAGVIGCDDGTNVVDASTGGGSSANGTSSSHIDTTSKSSTMASLMGCTTTNSSSKNAIALSLTSLGPTIVGFAFGLVGMILGSVLTYCVWNGRERKYRQFRRAQHHEEMLNGNHNNNGIMDEGSSFAPVEEMELH